MKLSREEIKEAMAKNSVGWDNRDLDGVLELYHDDVYFENWTGGHAQGKKALHEAWTPWFTSGGDFKFNREDLFVDEDEQWKSKVGRCNLITTQRFIWRTQSKFRKYIEMGCFFDNLIH